MVETYLAQAIAVTDKANIYDTNVKYLLADKQILAWVLKYTLKEFENMEISDIISCICDDIEVGSRYVDPGLSNFGRVHVSNTEDSVPGEGKIFYDIRFTAYHKGIEMIFLINLEAQTSTDPAKLGYHLEHRIIYYMSRMVSGQKHTEFFHSDYDNLKNVRSIWICMDRDEDGDSIEEISLVRRTVFGGIENSCELGLMKGIIVHLRKGENLEESKNQLVAMLEKLFSGRSVSEKKRILKEDFGMVMTVELEGRLQSVCNWSEVVIEKGLKLGIERGVEQGIEQGMNLKMAELVRIKRAKGKSVAQIAEELEETEECIEVLIKTMS